MYAYVLDPFRLRTSIFFTRHKMCKNLLKSVNLYIEQEMSFCLCVCVCNFRVGVFMVDINTMNTTTTCGTCSEKFKIDISADIYIRVYVFNF